MSGAVVDAAGRRLWLCDDSGPQIAGERDASDILGEAFGARAEVVAIPLARLPPVFLDLKTRLAGELLQKFVNYGLRVAILGDVAAACERSAPLRDFVHESNGGRHVWFVPDLAALTAKLAQA